jgi:ethanolamine utilization protein EutA
VIGTGAQSLNISGGTIQVHDQILPLRTCLVISPFSDGVPEQPEAIGAVLRQFFACMGEDVYDQQIAVALKGPSNDSFQQIRALAQGLVLGMEHYLQQGRPLVVVLEDDCGKALGQCLEAVMGMGAEVICIDQVWVDEGDYIDIGKTIMDGTVVPVVVKTLVFNTPVVGGEFGVDKHGGC